MIKVQKSALVPFSAEQMFDLVNDVETYPEFIPGCQATELVESSEDQLVGTLHLSVAGIKLTLTTRNQLQRPSQMDLTLESGPFSSLTGRWRFTPLGDLGCKVELDLSFEPDSKIIGVAAGTVLSQVAGQMVSAFSKRAEQVYD